MACGRRSKNTSCSSLFGVARKIKLIIDRNVLFKILSYSNYYLILFGGCYFLCQVSSEAS